MFYLRRPNIIDPRAGAPARDSAAAEDLEERLLQLHQLAKVELDEATKARRNYGEMVQSSKAAQFLQQMLHQREVEHRTLELEEHQLQAAVMKLSMLRAALEGEEAHHRMAEAACAEERRLEESCLIEQLRSQEALQESAAEQLNTEAAPFLTVGEEKLWRQRKELKSCHRDISRLQEELSQSELQERARRTAAENVAESEQQAHDCEKEKREQSLRELLSLQQRLSAAEVDRTSPALDYSEAGQSSEMDDLQATNQRLQEQVASLKALAERCQPTASESFADVLRGAGNRVISQMKDLRCAGQILQISSDLAGRPFALHPLPITRTDATAHGWAVGGEDVTKKELEDRCDRERRLRAELEERLKEPTEADVSATIAETRRARRKPERTVQRTTAAVQSLRLGCKDIGRL
eukprot:s14_g22.t1